MATAPVVGPVMRWSQNEWKANWLVVDTATRLSTVV